MTHITCRVVLPCPHVTEHYGECSERERVSHWAAINSGMCIFGKLPTTHPVDQVKTWVLSLTTPHSHFIKKSCQLSGQNITPAQPLLTTSTIASLVQAITFPCQDYRNSLSCGLLLITSNPHPCPSLFTYHKQCPLQTKVRSCQSLQ